MAHLAGELLRIRRSHTLGDAGALVFQTHPDLFEAPGLAWWSWTDGWSSRAHRLRPSSTWSWQQTVPLDKAFVEAVEGSR